MPNFPVPKDVAPRRKQVNKPPGRSTKYGEPLSNVVKVLFTDSQVAELVRVAGTHDVSAYIRGVVLGEEAGPAKYKVPLVGVACAGNDGCQLSDLAPGAFISVDFPVPNGAQAVTVEGKSMVSLNERISVPSGSHVIFRPDEYPVLGVSVLALVRDTARDEWRAMLKVYGGTQDGKTVLEPRNSNFETLRLPAEDVRITGTYFSHIAPHTRAAINSAARDLRNKINERLQDSDAPRQAAKAA